MQLPQGEIIIKKKSAAPSFTAHFRLTVHGLPERLQLPLFLPDAVVGAGDARAHRQRRVVMRLPALQPAKLGKLRVPGRQRWRLEPPHRQAAYGTAAPPRVLQSPKAQSLRVDVGQVHGRGPGLASLADTVVPDVEGQRPSVQFHRPTFLLRVERVQVGVSVLVGQRGGFRVQFHWRLRVGLVLGGSLVALHQVLDGQRSHGAAQASIEGRLLLSPGSVALQNPGGGAPPWKQSGKAEPH